MTFALGIKHRFGAGASLMMALLGAALAAPPLHAQSQQDQPPANGIGADPDRDGNPATNTDIIPFYTDAAAAADDPPYAVITFEPPPGAHGEAIRKDYETQYGVTFGEGLTWQICDRQRHFQYDTLCTYFAPASGRFSAGYSDRLNRPLEIEFARPVCIVTLSIYPTGAKEGEPFEFTVEGWAESGEKLATAKVGFEWTNNTVRWRNMAGAYFADQRAKKIAVSMRSKDGAEANDLLRYLLDDLAFVDEGCEEALKSVEKRAGADLDPGDAQGDEKAEDLEEKTEQRD
jgi:hypothetical protein